MTLALLVQKSSLLLRWTQRNLYVCSMSTPWMFTGVIWGVFLGCLSPSLCLASIDMKMVEVTSVDKVPHDPPVFQFVFFWKMSNNGCGIRWTSGCDNDTYRVKRQKERAPYPIGPLASPWAVMDVWCCNWKRQKTQPCAGGRWLHSILAAWSWCHLVLWLFLARSSLAPSSAGQQ